MDISLKLDLDYFMQKYSQDGLRVGSGLGLVLQESMRVLKQWFVCKLQLIMSC